MIKQTMILSNISVDHMVEMFGGHQRLAFLHRHFQYLQTNGIDLGIVSFCHREVILLLLFQVRLSQYFTAAKIFGTQPLFEFHRTHPQAIKSTIISKRFTEVPAVNRLFVSNDEKSVTDVILKGVAEVFNTLEMGTIVNGLSVKQMEWIEEQCDIAARA